MLVSILHRATGIAMATGTAFVVWMLLALATGESAYECFRTFITHPVGRLMLFGWTVAVFFHMGNGIRHLIWDLGFGYEIGTARRSALAVFAFALVMTLIVWCVACPWQ